jgi:predicted nucleotidyltransferase
MKKEKNLQLEKLKPKIVKILKNNGIKKAGIFGSYARGEQNKKSDIDILIELDEKSKFSLFDLAGLEMELKKILKIDVDVLTYKSIHSLLKERILSEEVKII